MQVDKGTIKFILSGANIMCPGITSNGGSLDDGIQIGYIVIVNLENYDMPVAVGISTMTSEKESSEKGLSEGESEEK